MKLENSGRRERERERERDRPTDKQTKRDLCLVDNRLLIQPAEMRVGITYGHISWKQKSEQLRCLSLCI